MNYAKWSSQSDAELASVDIAILNLEAATGLPSAESLQITALIHRLDQWTSLVATKTQHWRRNFKPTDDCLTENHFCMMAMMTVVQRDLGVGYNPACMTGPHDARDSRDNFLHGPLTGHGGTCSSLPVLYLAIGRRLDYPLYLVSAREHFFVRWDDGGKERFNVECAGVGFVSHSDEYYTHSPKPLSAKELASGFFLQNHTPREELASFIGNRGHCLMDNIQHVQALEAYRHAAKLHKYYDGHLMVAKIMQEIFIDLQAGGLPANLSIRDRIEIGCSPPRNALERWAIPIAQNEVLRITQLHASRKPKINFTPETYIVSPK